MHWTKPYAIWIIENQIFDLIHGHVLSLGSYIKNNIYFNQSILDDDCNEIEIYAFSRTILGLSARCFLIACSSASQIFLAAGQKNTVKTCRAIYYFKDLGTQN